jgi:hypothetical protein
MSAIDNKLDKMPNDIVNGLQRVLEDNGASAGNLTRENLRQVLLDTLSQVGFQASNIESESPSANDSTKIHTWGDGRFHLLPQDYELPKTDIFHGWILWSVGDDQSNIPPLRKLTKHDCGSRKLQQTLSD